MSTRGNSHSDRPNTYFVQNRSHQDEITRLLVQDQMLTRGMGGVLPEQPEPASFERVLDVGCGIGGWLIETATTYPDMSKLIGIDISERMVSFARKQAQEQQVDDRVEFHVMDALLMLEFPADYFDLVNLRLGWSYLRTWDWPKLLSEFQRVTKHGGVIRITDCEALMKSTSPALTRMLELSLNAFYQAGHFFRKESDGVTGELARLLHQYGIGGVQTRLHPLVYRAGTPEWQHFYEDMRRIFPNALAFYQKWSRVSADTFEELYQQLLREIQQPDFVATWNYLTVWGTNMAPAYLSAHTRD